MKNLSIFFKRKIALGGLLFIVLLLLFALFSPYIATFDPQEMNPVDKLRSPDGTYYFGTDNFGRDIFSRVCSEHGQASQDPRGSSFFHFPSACSSACRPGTSEGSSRTSCALSMSSWPFLRCSSPWCSSPSSGGAWGM